MAIDLKTGAHAIGNASKLLATRGGAHIYNVVLSTDADNSNLIARGGASDFDQYAEATATEFKGKIQWAAYDRQAETWGYYVEVTADTNALYVFNYPDNPYNSPFDSTKFFYNKAGSVVRAHELKVGDILFTTPESFSGTPEVGAEIDGISKKKLVVVETTESTDTESTDTESTDTEDTDTTN